MAHFNEIYSISIDNYDLVTAAQAREINVTSVELRRWCLNGRLERRGQGVYKLAHWVPTPYDSFAEALALVDPRAIQVATPKRARRSLPSWVDTAPTNEADKTTFYEGIRSQRVADAVKECRTSTSGTH